MPISNWWDNYDVEVEVTMKDRISLLRGDVDAGRLRLGEALQSPSSDLALVASHLDSVKAVPAEDAATVFAQQLKDRAASQAAASREVIDESARALGLITG